MKVRFVLFRYQADLTKDEWVPLGVVVECPLNDENEIGVACLQGETIANVSELGAAMLQDVPAILNKEVDSTRALLRPGQDFLELLRAKNPWNFHFTVPKTEDVPATDLLEATFLLFNRHVFRHSVPIAPPAPGIALKKSRASQATPKPVPDTRRIPPKSIRPRRMEVYEVAV